jgi:hypothetical protein
MPAGYAGRFVSPSVGVEVEGLEAEGLTARGKVQRTDLLAVELSR